MSEKYRDSYPNYLFSNSLVTATLKARNEQEFLVRSLGRHQGFIWAWCLSAHLYSWYITSNEAIQEFIDKIDRLEET